ncbi:MAG TPA: phosphatase PAP2 family protein, partial [Chitinophagaceae bacterium]|nr:phosphatase PAP2 family protein [Chitinophagaceae bacterium]
VCQAQEDTTRKTTDSLAADSVHLDTVITARLSDVTLHKGMTKDVSTEVYKIKPAVDIPIVVAATAFSLYGFSEIYNKPSSTEAEINRLRMRDINGFDRWAADQYSEKAVKHSDALFYGAMPAPFLLFIDKKIRKDALKVIFLYWETMGVTGIYYTGLPMVWDRYRPLAYNPAVPMHERTSGNAKNSFLAGHVALVATSTFFIAKVYSDYNPDSKVKWLFYTGASAATLATGYLRHRGGKHFPSDIVAGTVMGTLTGILVPHFHKHRIIKNPNLSIRPFTGESHGLAIVYKL